MLKAERGGVSPTSQRNSDPRVCDASGLHPTADSLRLGGHVRLVPEADVW